MRPLLFVFLLFGLSGCKTKPDNVGTDSRHPTDTPPSTISETQRDSATETETVDPCASQPCQNGGTCVQNGAEFSCDCPKGYGNKLCDGEFAPPSGFDGLHGYIGYSTGDPPAGYDMGMGFYASVWGLVGQPIGHFQIGLPGVWITPNNRDNSDTPLCPVGSVARDNWPERAFGAFQRGWPIPSLSAHVDIEFQAGGKSADRH